MSTRRVPRRNTATRRLEPEARATVAIAFGREQALQTVMNLMGVQLGGQPDRYREVDDAIQAAFRSFDDHMAAESKAFPLCIWTQGIWTIIEDPRDSLPGDPLACSSIASILGTQVASRVMRPADQCYGFMYYDEDRCRRLFLQVHDAVIEDEGALADEDPPMRLDPQHCIDAAWLRLVPFAEPQDIEVRLFRPATSE
ncbi:MAG: hypothetical protein ACYTGX_04975 [Planctomycetota bacterium]|jgi:hypothetical protein